MKIFDNEAYLIETLSSKYIGDDAAVIGKTLYSMDAFFEDVHFKREWMSLSQIGKKAMLVNISDAIAMNAQPKYALVSVSIPQNFTHEEIDELMQSLEETAQEYGCEIIGGDTISCEKLHLSITIISHSSSPLLRKGLKEGNLLAYTGTLGESKKDLERLQRGEKIEKNSRFYVPTIRDTFIRKARKYLTSGMDISDGLYCDTNKLLELNHCGFLLLEEVNDSIGLSGEEYEMLISFSPENLVYIEKIAKETNTPIHIFAKIIQNNIRFTCKSHHF